MKLLFRSIVIAVILVGCSKANDKTAANREVVGSMFDAFNKHDWEKMASFYAPNAEFLDPSFGKEYVIKSRKETVAKYSGYQQQMPDIQDELVSMEAIGDKVIVEFISTGTITGGPSFRLPIVSILTLKDGVIIKDATYYDQP